MKNAVLLIFVGAALWMTACSSNNDKSKDKTELTTEQEIKKVDSANRKTSERIEDIEKLTRELQSEIDTLLNQINKK